MTKYSKNASTKTHTHTHTHVHIQNTHIYTHPIDPHITYLLPSITSRTLPCIPSHPSSDSPPRIPSSYPLVSRCVRLPIILPVSHVLDTSDISVNIYTYTHTSTRANTQTHTDTKRTHTHTHTHTQTRK